MMDIEKKALKKPPEVEDEEMDFDGRIKGELDALRWAVEELVVVAMPGPEGRWVLLFWERKGENALPRVEFILPDMQSAIGEL